MNKLNELTIKDALEGLKSNKFTSIDITNACLEQISALDADIHAFITVTAEHALERAAWADSIIKDQGDSAFNKYPLLGIPYALKDNMCTKGIRTTASSKIIDNFVPPYESTVSQKLYDAGAVLLGKTNLDAFAHGSSTESSDFFTTKNPHNTNHLPGGSSGGSAAATASNMCIFSIGTETAGSIRQPSAWCGTVGLKPTYGRVSRYGAIAMASSTDSPGPITKTVEDAAFILELIAGVDKHDATSSPKETALYTDFTSFNIKDIKIGIAKSYFMKDMEGDVSDSVKETIDVLKKIGFTCQDIDLMDPTYSIAVYTIIQRSEVSSNLARFDGIRYGHEREKFGFEAKKRIMLGTYTLSAGYQDKYYLQAEKVRTLIIEDFNKAFKDIDIIVGPVTPSKALPIGASEGNAMFGELQDALLEPSSMAGLPGISIPCGFSNGLPIGIQFIANKFDEHKLLYVAKVLEEALNKAK